MNGCVYPHARQPAVLIEDTVTQPEHKARELFIQKSKGVAGSQDRFLSLAEMFNATWSKKLVAVSIFGTPCLSGKQPAKFSSIAGVGNFPAGHSGT